MKQLVLDFIKTRKRVLIYLSIILVIIITYFISKKEIAIYQDIKVVEIEKINKKNINKTTSLIAKIKAKYSANLITQASGILNIIVEAGANVTKGTLIAKINNIEVERLYSLTSSAEIIAKDQYDRAKRLLNSGAYSKSDFEITHNRWINAKKDKADAKIAFDKLNFYAPFDGIIGVYKFKDGEQLRGNEQIVSFYDPKNVTLELDIPSSLVPYVNNGQDLTVLGKHYKLTHIQKMLDEEKHMSPAFVDITCEDCLIGSNLDVDLTVIQKNNIIMIPYEAIFNNNGNSMVYIVKNDIVEPRKINLGIREKEEIEVISGLEEEEMIIARNPSRLYPGCRVKIHESIK